MKNLNNDLTFNLFWELKQTFFNDGRWNRYPVVTEYDFVKFCQYIINAGMENSLDKDSPVPNYTGKTEVNRRLFSCCLGKHNKEIIHAGILRDEYGVLLILLLYTGHCYVVCRCMYSEPCIYRNINSEMNKYFDNMSDEDKCLLTFSGMEDVKEVFEL